MAQPECSLVNQLDFYTVSVIDTELTLSSLMDSLRKNNYFLDRGVSSFTTTQYWMVKCAAVLIVFPTTIVIAFLARFVVPDRKAIRFV